MEQETAEGEDDDEEEEWGEDQVLGVEGVGGAIERESTRGGAMRRRMATLLRPLPLEESRAAEASLGLETPRP
ncbi:hypothetical protein EV182_005474, partial [Spiromyces aspiralis]